MMGMGNNMTGKEVNNMGHRMFPQYKGVKTGQALFHYEGCFMCHTINGYGGMMGPNLSHIGSKRSFSWIATQIADPSAHFKRNSVVTLNGVRYRAVMPSFKNISSMNIGILAKYLESLK
jgi:putative heme-binding domain-containing protein